MDLDWVVDRVEDVHNSLKFPVIKLESLQVANLLLEGKNMGHAAINKILKSS